MTLHVAGLWRYPVKTLGGEPLSTAVLGPDGIPGDRIVRVRGPEGVRTSRRQYRLLGLRGTLGDDGHPRINGRSWDSPEALALVRSAAGADAWLEDPEVLRDIVRRFGSRLALNADVVRGGTIRVGDCVRLVSASSTR